MSWWAVAGWAFTVAVWLGALGCLGSVLWDAWKTKRDTKHLEEEVARMQEKIRASFQVPSGLMPQCRNTLSGGLVTNLGVGLVAPLLNPQGGQNGHRKAGATHPSANHPANGAPSTGPGPGADQGADQDPGEGASEDVVPDVIEPFVGFREMLTHDSMPVIVNWRPGVNEAVCKPEKWYGTLGLARGFGKISSPCAQVPHPECQCGYYALKDMDEVIATWSPGALLYAAVALSGRVIRGQTGYRAQKAEIVALFAAKPSRAVSTMTMLYGSLAEETTSKAEQVAKRYGVPLFYDLLAFEEHARNVYARQSEPQEDDPTPQTWTDGDVPDSVPEDWQ